MLEKICILQRNKFFPYKNMSKKKKKKDKVVEPYRKQEGNIL